MYPRDQGNGPVCTHLISCKLLSPLACPPDLPPLFYPQEAALTEVEVTASKTWLLIPSYAPYISFLKSIQFHWEAREEQGEMTKMFHIQLSALWDVWARAFWQGHHHWITLKKYLRSLS